MRCARPRPRPRPRPHPPHHRDVGSAHGRGAGFSRRRAGRAAEWPSVPRWLQQDRRRNAFLARLLPFAASTAPAPPAPACTLTFTDTHPSIPSIRILSLSPPRHSATQSDTGATCTRYTSLVRVRSPRCPLLQEADMRQELLGPVHFLRNEQ